MNIRLVLFFRKFVVLRKIGLKSFLRYSLATNGKELTIPIYDNDIVVRKGTPDLEVALSCLGGEFEMLRYLLPRDYSGSIVDAGGYIGTATIAMRGLFPHSRIIILEPSEANLGILKQNLLNIENIEIIHGALVGEKTKSIQLKNRGSGEWGFTVVNNPQDKKNPEIVQDTPAYTLSELVSDVKEIGLLKLDIEGGEYELINKDEESLQKIKIVFAELHDRILEGCTKSFLNYSKDRILIKDSGEKYLSIMK